MILQTQSYLRTTTNCSNDAMPQRSTGGHYRDEQKLLENILPEQNLVL